MMKGKNKIFFYLSILSLVLFTLACSSNKKITKILINVDELNEISASNDKTIFIDVQNKEDYDREHLPGAISIVRKDMESKTHPYSGMLASRQDIEKLLSKLGISSDSKLIIYDNKGQVEAARLWWALHRYGFKNMHILDGGISAWKNKKQELEHKKNQLTKTNFKFKNKDNSSYSAELKDVQQAILDENTLIIDCRTEDEVSGKEIKEGAFRGGKIPTSIWINHSEMLNKDNSFKSPEVLKRLFEAKGVLKSNKIITYCHSGVRSAEMTFVLSQILDYKQVKNYDGSWVEWSFYKELPIVQE